MSNYQSLLITDLKGYPVPVYESASTSMFKHGRTETIRPCTDEAIQTAKLYKNVSYNNYLSYDSLYDSQLDVTDLDSCIELMKMLKKAIRAHNNQTKNCLGGQGWDRHIFGLKTQGTLTHLL